jgi:hypothetical protein
MKVHGIARQDEPFFDPVIEPVGVVRWYVGSPAGAYYHFFTSIRADTLLLLVQTGAAAGYAAISRFSGSAAPSILPPGYCMSNGHFLRSLKT